jgi:PAS domain S-box-containing protein
VLSSAHFSRPARSALRLLWTAGLGGVAVFTIAAAGGPGDPRSDGYHALYVALFLIAGGLCLLRALLVREQRLPWAACAAAMCCWAGGESYWFVVVADLPSPAYPSWSDGLWLSYYAISFVGLLALTRSGIARLRRSVWIDVAVGALAISTLGAALLVRPIIASTGGSASAVATNLAYPLFDVLILSLVLAVFVVNDWRPGRAWMLLGCVWVLQAVTDTVYLDRSAAGTYAAGGLLDATWPALTLLIAFAAWQPPTRARRAWVRGPGTLAVTIAFGVVGLSVLVADQSYDFGQATLVLAALTVLFGFVRAAMTYGDMKSLAQGRELSAQRASILDAAGDGIMGIDADGMLTFANPAAASMVGYGPQELIARDLHSLLHRTRPDGSAYPRAQCPALASLVDGSVHRCDHDVYRRKDGSRFPVSYTSNPIVDGDRITGAVVVFRDITVRREIERIKDEFISVVSHELRTPLTSIRASLGLLESGVLGTLPEDGRRMIEIAVRNSDRLVYLINDILDLERIEAGTMSLHHEICDGAQLIACAVESVLPTATESSVTLTIGAGSAPLEADAERIIQTLTNLIGNAVKFSPRNSTVHVCCLRRHDEVLFTVSDRGCGIPAPKLETIFERFEQVDSSHSRGKGGTGLGLAICRSIVDAHGGRIWACSTPGQGSMLSFVVPAARRSSDAIEAHTDGGYELRLPASTMNARSVDSGTEVEDEPRVALLIGSPYPPRENAP